MIDWTRFRLVTIIDTNDDHAATFRDDKGTTRTIRIDRDFRRAMVLPSLWDWGLNDGRPIPALCGEIIG